MDVRLLDNHVKMEGPAQVLPQLLQKDLITLAHVLMAFLGRIVLVSVVSLLVLYMCMCIYNYVLIVYLSTCA